MRTQNQLAPGQPGVAGARVIRWERLLLAAVLLLGALLYLQHAFQYFMYDDEGSYAYAAWRVSLGEVPYRDFLTPQMPVFLYWGGLLVRLFGRSWVVLRLASMAAMLITARILYAAERRLFGPAVALLATGLFVFDANIFHNARFYRPEVYMLLFQALGLYCLILSEERRRLGYLALASVFYSLAILSKLFGLLAFGGCFLYLLYAWWRERRPWSQVWRQGVALGLPALLLLSVVAAIFYRATPYFFVAIIEHHTMQGAQLSMLQVVAKGLRFFWEYATGHLVLLILAGVGAFALLRQHKALPTVLVWQLPTVLSFLVLSRELAERHLTYLSPALTGLAALALVPLFQGQGQWLPRRWMSLLGPEGAWGRRLLPVVLTLAVAYPSIRMDADLSSWREDGTARLAAFIQQLTSPNDVVLADYPGINFAAGRPNTYWGAGMSGGAAGSGQIRGSMLIDEIERENVAMVIINTAGGAHQMIAMHDYPEFRRYVQSHFALQSKALCWYESLEVYSRADAMPLKPDLNFHNELALTGLRLSQNAIPAGSPLAIDTRWQALQKMGRNYHVSLRLVDATGRLWAQRDELLQEVFSHFDEQLGVEVYNEYHTSSWEPQQVVLQSHQLLIPPTTPPGDYYLVARLYELSSGLALPPGRGLGPRLPEGDSILATVRVLPTAARLDPASLHLATSRHDAFAGGLTLVGSGPLPHRATTGQSLRLTLLWQASQRPTRDYRLEFRLVQGGKVGQQWRPDVVAGFPTEAWREGEVALGNYRLPLDSRLPAGDYSLQVGVIDETGEATHWATLIETLELKARVDPATLSQAISHPLTGLSFGGQFGLLGYDLAPKEVTPGGEVELTLYWTCEEEPSGDYKVFTHLLDGAAQIQGQSDGAPGGGRAPTSSWLVGDVVADDHELALQAAAQPGPLQIEIGFYDPVTGQRLPVLRDGQPTGEDRVILPTTVLVRQPSR